MAQTRGRIPAGVSDAAALAGVAPLQASSDLTTVASASVVVATGTSTGRCTPLRRRACSTTPRRRPTGSVDALKARPIARPNAALERSIARQLFRQLENRPP